MPAAPGYGNFVGSKLRDRSVVLVVNIVKYMKLLVSVGSARLCHCT